MDSRLEQARTRFFEGIAHFEAGRLDEARTAFESSLQFAPGRPSVLGNLGITLFHLGRAEEALPMLTQATAADPAYAEGWGCLGLALETLGRWEEAAPVLERALQLVPENAALCFCQGRCLARAGHATQALQSFDRALAVDSRLGAAWSARGTLLRELHRLDEAAACFEKALELGDDPELNGYYLASVRNANGSAPPAAPRRYVEALFDEYAPQFQSHLLEHLRYQGHEVLLRPLLAGERRFRRALDLGCGTGLCGALLQSRADVVDGVDLSRAMLDQARVSGAYRKLDHADIAAFLEQEEGQGRGQERHRRRHQERGGADLVLAADVFIYIGDVAAIFHSVRRVLDEGGIFAFTVEETTGAGELELLPSLRYAHSEGYVRDLAKAAGFTVDALHRAPIRYDQERPVEGLYVYLR